MLMCAVGTGRSLRAHYGQATGQVTIAGVSGSTDVIAFDGDASWGGFAMVTGHSIGAPGEAVVPATFLAATGASVGDRVILDHQGEQVTVRIVGTVLDTRNDGMEVFTDLATFTAAHIDLRPTTHYIALRPGTDRADYLDTLNADLAPLHLTANAPAPGNGSDQVVALNSLTRAGKRGKVGGSGSGDGGKDDEKESAADGGARKCCRRSRRATTRAWATPERTFPHQRKLLSTQNRKAKKFDFTRPNWGVFSRHWQAYRWTQGYPFGRLMP
ncbi:hypothetical protein ACWEWL_10525 [Streptomyces rochei]